jgi:SNW domain-containing protein 1
MIPPCISNWKNAKGYTIPLDKRLAADGRGVQKITINDNFARLSEALFVADRHARQEVKIRNEMATKVVEKEKRDKEEQLRALAQRARDERNGVFKAESSSGSDSDSSSGSSSSGSSSDSDDDGVAERDAIRKDRARQHAREVKAPAKAYVNRVN